MQIIRSNILKIKKKELKYNIYLLINNLPKHFILTLFYSANATKKKSL